MFKFSMLNGYKNFWKNKKTFVTGHTGFKGSWLTYILKKFDAKVTGYSLKPYTNPSLFFNLNKNIKEDFNDIRDYNSLEKSIKSSKPEIIFHLAAQPIVLDSYKFPLDTFETNVTGTLNLLEILKTNKYVKSIVIVTSDKVYENKEWDFSYRENDRLGGFDPYSSSKACVEIVTKSYQKSFFESRDINICTARGGNVIGGGDWSNHRLIPDLIRAIYHNDNLNIRYPYSTRPWQHVIEPIMGYIELAEKGYQKKIESGNSFNFGPGFDKQTNVKDMIEKFLIISNKKSLNIKYENNDQLHEAKSLSLNIDKSLNILNWRPQLSLDENLFLTANWYKNFYLGKKCYNLIDNDLDFYFSKLANSQKAK